MKRSIISLLLIGTVISSTLISCGKTETPPASDNNNASVTEEQSGAQDNNAATETAPSDNSGTAEENPALVGENNKPTVTVNKIGDISQFKEKDDKEIKSLLGNPENKNDTVYTYVKDNYTFEVTYFDAKCGKIKVTPKSDLKYPADAANVLHLFGISAGQPDTMSPSSFSWDNQFDTYKITVTSDDAVVDKIKDVEIIFDKSYE